MRANRIALITTAILIGFTDFSFSQDVKYRSSLEVEGICEDCIKAQLKVSGDVDNVNNQFRDLAKKVNIFGKDDRVQQTRRGPANPFAAIGMIATLRKQTNGEGKVSRGIGTAFMVSPCLAVTNYHVIFGEKSSNDVIPDVIELGKQMAAFRETKNTSSISLPDERNYGMVLSIGEKPDGSFKYRVVGTPVAFGEDTYDPVGKDWALVQFDPPNCPGEDPEIGWLEFASASTPTEDLLSTSVQSAGYPGDLLHEISNKMPLFRTGLCKLHQPLEGGGGFAHDCASRGGQSGSPIFATINGQTKVVGIMSGEMNRVPGILPAYDPKSFESRNHANIAVDARYFFPGIRKRIERDTSAYYLRHANEDRVSKPHTTSI